MTIRKTTHTAAKQKVKYFKVFCPCGSMIGCIASLTDKTMLSSGWGKIGKQWYCEECLPYKGKKNMTTPTSLPVLIYALQILSKNHKSPIIGATERLAEAATRMQAMATALLSIANSSCCDGCMEAKKIAVHALEGK